MDHYAPVSKQGQRKMDLNSEWRMLFLWFIIMKISNVLNIRKVDK